MSDLTAKYCCEGGLPFAVYFAKGGACFSCCDAQTPEALLRTKGFAFPYVLLLPPAALSRNGPRQESPVKVLAEVRRKFDFLLVGYVIMPDHVHLLLSEPKKGNLSRVLQVLKQRVSRVMRGRNRRVSKKQMALSFGDSMNGDRRFWQRRFYDFNVWSHAKKKEKLHYMHANPVKERLVGHPKDWPWSSFSFYAKDERGLIPIDPVD